MNSFSLLRKEHSNNTSPITFLRNSQKCCCDRAATGDGIITPNSAVVDLCQGLARFATLVTDVPDVQIVRDRSDDMIVACAIGAGADYLVTRDNDLLVLGRHRHIAIITPEAFLHVLRSEK